MRLTESPLHHLWLNWLFFLVRAVLYLLLWLVFAVVIVRNSRQQDRDGDPAWTSGNVHMMIMPSQGQAAAIPGLIEAGLFMGMVGLFVLAFFRALSKASLVPLHDPTGMHEATGRSAKLLGVPEPHR
jgi:hypothetical protein